MATDIYCDQEGCHFRVNGLCRCSTIALEDGRCTSYDDTPQEEGEFDEPVEVHDG